MAIVRGVTTNGTSSVTDAVSEDSGVLAYPTCGASTPAASTSRSRPLGEHRVAQDGVTSYATGSRRGVRRGARRARTGVPRGSAGGVREPRATPAVTGASTSVAEVGELQGDVHVGLFEKSDGRL